MTYMKIKTQTGTAMILMTEVVAIVRRHHDNISMAMSKIDLHMRSGTIFVIPNYNEEDYNALLNMWEMFNRDNWNGRSPGYVEGGEMHEL